MSQRKWTDENLRVAVKLRNSYRAVIKELGLIPAGGNYRQVQRRINELSLDTQHFTGKGWNVGLVFRPRVVEPLEKLLINGIDIQSNTLKKRLFNEGIFLPKCQICGWAQQSLDGRIPVELDHINGNNKDNRIKNLRILCPNCHSLQLTHRGKNMKRLRPGDEIGKHS